MTGLGDRNEMRCVKSQPDAYSSVSSLVTKCSYENVKIMAQYHSDFQTRVHVQKSPDSLTSIVIEQTIGGRKTSCIKDRLSEPTVIIRLQMLLHRITVIPPEGIISGSLLSGLMSICSEY
jgi:hypothetical protein